jgi:hypothetical protein
MPLNISWSKFQEKIENVLAYSILYALSSKFGPFYRNNVLYSLCILTFHVIMSRLSEHVLPQVVGVEGVEGVVGVEGQHSLRQSDQHSSLSILSFSVSFLE